LTWSTIELNVSIVCASLLVMKPLFVRFAPAILSEQPMSAREDARLWRGATGLGLLVGRVEDEEKAAESRRDTAVAMSVRSVGRLEIPARVLESAGKARSCQW
jgi:hypothetical protein